MIIIVTDNASWIKVCTIIGPGDPILLRGDLVADLDLIVGKAHFVVLQVVVVDFHSDVCNTVFLRLVSPAVSGEVLVVLAPGAKQSLLHLVESKSDGDLWVALVDVPSAVWHDLRSAVRPDRAERAFHFHGVANRCKVVCPVLAVQSHDAQVVGSSEERVDCGEILGLAGEHFGLDVAVSLVDALSPVVVLPPRVVVDGFPVAVGVVELLVLVGTELFLLGEEGSIVGVSVPLSVLVVDGAGAICLLRLIAVLVVVIALQSSSFPIIILPLLIFLLFFSILVWLDFFCICYVVLFFGTILFFLLFVLFVPVFMFIVAIFELIFVLFILAFLDVLVLVLPNVDLLVLVVAGGLRDQRLDALIGRPGVLVEQDEAVVAGLAVSQNLYFLAQVHVVLPRLNDFVDNGWQVGQSEVVDAPVPVLLPTVVLVVVLRGDVLVAARVLGAARVRNEDVVALVVQRLGQVAR